MKCRKQVKAKTDPSAQVEPARRPSVRCVSAEHLLTTEEMKGNDKASSARRHNEGGKRAGGNRLLVSFSLHFTWEHCYQEESSPPFALVSAPGHRDATLSWTQVLIQ